MRSGTVPKALLNGVFIPTGRRSFHLSPFLLNADEELGSQLKSHLKGAMKERNSLKSTVIRSLLSEQQYAAKAGSGGSLSSILQRAISKRQDSARQFRAAVPPREDLAEKEDQEVDIIKAFLPEQISVEELEQTIKETIAEAQAAGASGKKMLGDVMKRISSKIDKARAPGGLVSETVKRLLPKD